MVQLGKTSNNIFKGMDHCLSLYYKAGCSITEEDLTLAYIECGEDQAKRQMFWSLLFSKGDITNRQHNIFHKEVKDDGGNADRQAWYTIINWMFVHHPKQFQKFLNAGLFNEFVSFDALTASRIQTGHNSRNIVKIYDVFANPAYRSMLSDYFVSIINGNNPFNKMLLCKYLSLPRLSKRQGHKRMLPETKQVMKHKFWFLQELSEKMGWNYEGFNFKDYRAFRKLYNQDLESVLFSTGRITEFDQVHFTEWLEHLPAAARQRVVSRISGNTKWNKLVLWYNEWYQNKSRLQEEKRILEEKVRKGLASESDILRLSEVVKQAKVTVGANNFISLYNDIKSGKADELALESFIEKVNLPYDSLVLIDDSGSMTGEPFNFACFLATVCLYKNPNGRDLLGFFASNAHFHLAIDSYHSGLWYSRRKLIPMTPERFIDPSKSFYENYLRVSKFCNSVFMGGGTDLRSVTRYFMEIAEKNSEIKDLIKSFPVLTILSDGDINNCSTPRKSMQSFMNSAKKYLDWEPFVVLIDVARSETTSKFTGIKNMVHILNNPAQIEQFLTNMKDMDVADGYLPLNTMYLSNRYELVRSKTL